MAWTDGVDRATGTIITASIWNNFFGNSGNINLTAPYLAAAAGDLFQGSGSKVLAKLAKGTRNQYLTANAAANAVEWSASPASLMDAKGEVLSASAANTPVAVTKGTNDYVLEARASESAGVRFVSAGGGGSAPANPEGVYQVTSNNNYNPYLGSLTANRFYCFPLEPVLQACTVTNLVIRLGSTTGNYKLGIYTQSADYDTLTKVHESASTAFPSDSAGASLSGLNYELQPGIFYWLGAIADGTPTVVSMQTAQGFGNFNWYVNQASFALPDSVARSTFNLYGLGFSGGFLQNGGVATGI